MTLLQHRWIRYLPVAVASTASLGSRQRLPRSVSAVRAPLLLAALLLLDQAVGRWSGAADREDGTSGEAARQQAIDLAGATIAALHLAELGAALGAPIDLERVRRVITGAVMLGLGNILPKLPRNALVGIRTPWTLADPTVWERTHRLAGYLCAAAGLVCLPAAAVRGKRGERLQTFAILSAVTISAAYSAVSYYRRPQ